MKIDNSKDIKNATTVAALANVAVYNTAYTKKYIAGAPHIKHQALRELFTKLVIRVFNDAKKLTPIPKVLDLGAGEGSTTLQFLKLGAEVTAVDSSKSQLASLEQRCRSFKDKLNIYSLDVSEFLNSRNSDQYDIVVVSSFLHHIPDYLALIKKIMPFLSPQGQIFTFQDPLRYNTVNKFHKVFTEFSYFSWRIFRGDVIGGIQRKLRRSRGIFYDHCESDNVEYHVARNGVDHLAIMDLFLKEHFNCQMTTYFSTNSPIFQPLGQWLGVKNTFAIIAKR